MLARPPRPGRPRRPRRPHRPPRVPLLLAWLALACAGDDAVDRPRDAPADAPDTTASLPGPLDACALITREQVRETLGEEPGDPVVGMNEPGDERLAQVSQCTWPSARSNRMLTLLIRRAPTDQNTPAAIEQVRETLRSAGLTLRDVDGTGDAAFWTGTELHAFRGLREYLIVGLSGFDDEDAAIESARRAMAFVLARL